MTAFLKIDRCKSCGGEIPWEWVPPVVVGGKTLAGTGVWRSTLVDERCLNCNEAVARAQQRALRVRELRDRFVQLVGGTKPYREFTFERFRSTAANRVAFERARQFEPSRDNLYLWGPSRSGKTHLAVAILRFWFTRSNSSTLVTSPQLVRKLRMRPPEEEQSAIDTFIRAQILVVDDLGGGNETPYARKALQEIVDGRNFQERGGLVVTSQYSPTSLARRWSERAVPSRLADLCRVIPISAATTDVGAKEVRPD